MMNGFMLQVIKGATGKIEQNLNQILDSTLQGIAELKELPGYELELLVKLTDGVAEGGVYFRGDLVDTIDAVGLIEEVFEEQLKLIPAIAKKQVMKMMGGDSVEGLVLKLLESGSLKSKYDENDEIISYKIIEGKEELLDVAEFITSL